MHAQAEIIPFLHEMVENLLLLSSSSSSSSPSSSFDSVDT
jgi:hypothetical protein